MESHWAAENLQIIRTLMERSAIYRRALAPITFLVGSLGLSASAVGWFAGVRSPRAFGLYWLLVCLVAVAGAFWIVRRQALKEAEPFWSPPTRRVAQALSPAFFVGLICGLLTVLPRGREPSQVWWLPPVWMVLYGCAIHSAGFFMPQRMKLLGWGFVVCGCVVLAVVNTRSYAAGMPDLVNAHWLMGISFGGFHLACAVYLYFTEKKNET
jgi:cbb3-type cytochrome oxidase subunit 3